MKPKIKATCWKLQLQLLSFCLLCLSGKTRCDGNGPAVVTVEQDSDAVLPCSLSTKEDIESYHFEWKKAAQKKVFYYDAGITYDSWQADQSEEFKGRVSHFPEGLKYGNASIIINNTKVTDSGNYTCDFPDLQPRQTFHIKLVVEPVVVTVEQDEDALLPCSLSTKENIEQGYFYWYKLAQSDEKQKDVFQYEKGKHTPSIGSQDEGFKGRVSRFPQELKHGNASIIIRNTKMADNGEYTCVFPQRQTFHIKLVVDRVLKDRTDENITGVAPKPVVTTRKTQHGVLLLCEVQGRPQPTVEWKDSAGNVLPAGETQVSRRGSRVYFTVNTTVTRSDDFRCVATQETLSHQIYTEIYVSVNGAASKPNIRILQTKDRVLLQCEANGNPQPEVEWRDSAGNRLPAEEPQVTDRDGLFYVTLNTAVTKTDHYHCVATQKSISHQIYDETFVRIPGFPIVAVVVTFFVTLILVSVVLAVLVYKHHITLNSNKGSPADQKEGSGVPLKSQPSRPQEAPEPEP